ncbi:type II toxin-antitoxin system VapC family toxin [Achromobacter deleyi]|uniref:type II toxin-antitoxin system VapC family toxin n=1 Tax=Achromobacter deleyi TaxID=1353891 RepID=UPI001492785C|nr:type II toxin-antitoxin system VapC family toxin [Achromobacter deleyi]QVQ25973.1 type II toxin-antitoxin system VapC family toxin [Achromobacter deleyi]UIP21515.1 type II toxin-antitoxin system VapC family toxin [Achromobacter deleyi]
MIILDTNVISEILRPVPDARVVAWLEAQPRTALFTTTVTRGELLYGVRLLPEGQRRVALLEAVLAIFAADLAGQVLNFDGEAADAYAEIAAERRALGRPVSQFDAMIAGIARSRGASLATRNVRDFSDCGINVIDPWNC